MGSLKIEKAFVEYVGPTVQVSDSFRKRELIIKIDAETQYPQLIKIEAGQAKCDDEKLNEVRQGDEIDVYINLRGNQWLNPKTGVNEIFNQLSYWKMDIKRTTAQPQQQWGPPQQQQQTQGGYPTQQGFGAPQQAYGAPQQGFQQQAPQPQPAQQWGPPPAQPAQGFGQQQQYQQPAQQGFGHPQGPPPQQFGQQQQQFGPPNGQITNEQNDSGLPF